jgi:hypothetical protein
VNQKKCKICGLSFPATKEYFHVQTVCQPYATYRYLQPVCRTCRNKKLKETRRIKSPKEPKFCKCGTLLSKYRKVYCEECSSRRRLAMARKYYQTHKEQQNKYAKKWSQKQSPEYYHNVYLKRKDEVVKYNIEYYHKHKKEISERKKKIYLERRANAPKNKD